VPAAASGVRYASIRHEARRVVLVLDDIKTGNAGSLMLSCALAIVALMNGSR